MLLGTSRPHTRAISSACVSSTVSERTEGVLTVEFSRGTHRHSGEIPVAELQDHESARRAVTNVIRDLSKELAREQLEKAV